MDTLNFAIKIVWVIAGAITLITVALAIFMAKKRNGTAIGLKEIPPYYNKGTLLSEIEQVLFHRLIKAMPNNYVMVQVRLADIVDVGNSANRRAWNNKIIQNSVDFVICDKSLTVLACIELDDKTHEEPERQRADNNKDEALKAAGIPILRIKTNKMPSIELLKIMLEKTLLH